MRAKTSTVEGFTSNIITLVRYARQNWLSLGMYEYKIDPSAGSPTETLLRLLLPLSDLARIISPLLAGPKCLPNHSESVGATGGVYKGQGLNQRKLMTCAY